MSTFYMTNLFLEIIEINMLLISQVATQILFPYTLKHFVHREDDSSITRFLAKV